MQKIKMLKNMNNLLWILAGNTLYALGVALFILPAGLITGGTTGLALFFRFQFHIPILGFVLIFNVAMFLTGLAVLGKRFALTTLVSTFYYPIILGIIQRLAGSMVLNPGPASGNGLRRHTHWHRNRRRDTSGGFHRRHGYPASGLK